jgi:hypothetical protein
LNGRIHLEDTPEGRIAAAARVCFEEKSRCQTCNRTPMVCYYADLREFLQPITLKELLAARTDEAKKALHSSHDAQLRRIEELEQAQAILIERGRPGRRNE